MFPNVEMGQLGIKQDSEITSTILRSGDTVGIFHFATRYFNLTDCYEGDMTDFLQSKYSILMAHLQANGFLGARELHLASCLHSHCLDFQQLVTF